MSSCLKLRRAAPRLERGRGGQEDVREIRVPAGAEASGADLPDEDVDARRPDQKVDADEQGRDREPAQIEAAQRRHGLAAPEQEEDCRRTEDRQDEEEADAAPDILSVDPDVHVSTEPAPGFSV